MFQNTYRCDMFARFAKALANAPDAAAAVAGSFDYPGIRGTVRFYQTDCGVLVAAEIRGLPTDSEPCRAHVFAFHIHSGTSCSGNSDDPFSDALTHYNPCSCEHPHHAGDMPPLFSCGKCAFSAFLTNRFRIDEIIGKTVIIHSGADDFTSQPAGNAGAKIACGVIKPVCRHLTKIKQNYIKSKIKHYQTQNIAPL